MEKQLNVSTTRMQRLKDNCWPDIVDVESAKKAAKGGAAASAWVCISTCILMALGSVPITSLFDVSIFAVIGFGILKLSRVASISAIAFYLFEQGYFLSHGGKLSNPALMIILLLMFVSSVRATFIYHSIKGQA